MSDSDNSSPLPDLVIDLVAEDVGEDVGFPIDMDKIHQYALDLALVIPKNKFASLVLEIIQELTLGTEMSDIQGIHRGAIIILQRSAEKYIHRVFNDALTRVELSGRTTVCVEDLKVSHRFHGGHL